MSFPRAKIQRFNDVMSDVPSPTKYDPKLGDKVKGGCILKSEIKQTPFSDTASASSGKSCHTPVFRTPQMPKRHNCLGTSEKVNPNTFKSISFKSEDVAFLNSEVEIEELKALRVECSNKTETINDLEKHVQDLKIQILNHEKSKAKWEAYILELEAAKSTLECIKSNDENYEQQISEFQSQLKDAEVKEKELIKAKEELLLKLGEIEKKNNKLEEVNLDYERKLISLEGTIEQLEIEQRNKEKLIADLKQNEEVQKMNHKVALECLQGKILTLENEIKELDLNKSKNEATIFGLETQISNLNCSIEKLKTEKADLELSSNEMKSFLEDVKKACKNHEDTITGLEMELEIRTKDLQHLKNLNMTLKGEMTSIKSKLELETVESEEKLNKLIKNHERELSELNEKYKALEVLLESEKENFEFKRNDLVNNHAQEILQLQNDYESKLLTQMQENTDKLSCLQCQLDEKDNLLNKANAKHMKVLSEWEKKLSEAEKNFKNLVNELEVKHSDDVKIIEETCAKKIRMVELNSLKNIDNKNKEIDLLSEQYKIILEEVKSLLSLLEQKDYEIKNLSSNNKTLNSRIKVMLEEIKLLNREGETMSESLTKMTSKYNEEFSKNEFLSCKLGELDTKIIHLKEDLTKKVEDWKKSCEELRKFKNLNEKITSKRNELEKTVRELQDKINSLIEELNERKSKYENEIRKLNEEMTFTKSQCRKFEIVAGNTSKSLDALRIRLIESEKDVEKLNNENLSLSEELQKSENEKKELKSKYENLVEAEIDIQTTLDECLLENKQLLKKCEELESACGDLENKIKDLTLLKDSLENEKENHIVTMKDLVKNQELQLIEVERATLDQVEQFSTTLTEKLEFFMKFSAEKIKSLSSEKKNLQVENDKALELLKQKTYDYDNLFTDCEILKTTVDITVKESENLKNKFESQTNELDKAQNLIKELKEDKQTVEEKLAKKEKEFCSIERERCCIQEELKKINELLNQEKEKSICLKTQVLDLEAKVLKLTENENSLNERCNEYDNKVFELEKQIQNKITEIESHQNEKVIFIQEIKNLSREKNDLSFDLKIAEKKMKTNEKLVESIRNDKLDAEEKYKKQKLEYDGLFAEKCCLESELLCVKGENEKLRSEKGELLNVEERKNYYKENCKRLEKLIEDLKDDNSNLKNDFNEIAAVLKDKEKKIEELSKKCSDLESLIGPFREQLELYETERMLIENDREQLRKQHLEQAAELGHRNHKQKIQHVVNLKNSLLETRKENQKLLLEIKRLKKEIQKLQEQYGHAPKRLFIGGKRPESTPFKGKENSSLITSSVGMITPIVVKQEPMSPGSPLRNRNQ